METVSMRPYRSTMANTFYRKDVKILTGHLYSTNQSPMHAVGAICASLYYSQAGKYLYDLLHKLGSALSLSLSLSLSSFTVEPSYAKAKKTKSLTLHTFMFLGQDSHY